MKNASPWVFFNNALYPKEQVALSVFDVGVLRGAGIFDFFSVENGKPVFLADYLQRFFRSAERVNLPIPVSPNELTGIILNQIERNQLAHGGVRLLLTGGISENGFAPGEPQLIITNEPLFPPSEAAYQLGENLLLEAYTRDLPSVKTLNYLGAVRLIPQMKAAAATDVLYHTNGHITEASRSNFFLIKDHTLITAQSHILEGITRMKVLEIAHEQQLKVECRAVTIAELSTAQEAFICSTTKRILPIVQVGDQPIGSGQPGELTTQLMQWLNQKRQQHLSQQA